MGIVRGKRIDDKDQSDAEYRRQNVFGYVQNGVRTLFGFVCTSDRLLIFRPLCASATCAVPNSVKNMRKVKITFP